MCAHLSFVDLVLTGLLGFPKVSASFTNTASNGNRCRSANKPRCVAAHDTPLKAIDGSSATT